mgnify:CR=1 FL=1
MTYQFDKTNFFPDLIHTRTMPLSMLNIGDIRQVNKIHGKDETRRFLESLGFVSENGGNFIINVKGSRIALSKALASKIFVA